MKKGIVITLIISFSVLFLGAALLLGGMSILWAKQTAPGAASADVETVVYPLNAGTLHSLRVELGFTEIRILRAEHGVDARIEVTADSATHSRLSLSEQDGNASLEQAGIWSLISTGAGIPIGPQNYRADVYLPGNQLDQLTLSCAAGTISSEIPLSLGALTVNCGAGEATISHVEADRIRVDCGAGKMTLTDFTCRDLSVDGGAGDIILNDGTVSQRADFDIGTGKMTAQNTVLTGSVIQVGTGDVDFGGALHGSTRMDCGTGKIALTLDESADLYRVTAEHGLGSINANVPVNRVDANRIEINGASDCENRMDISIGMGHVDLVFAEVD